jgi:hypothetical protein
MDPPKDNESLLELLRLAQAHRDGKISASELQLAMDRRQESGLARGQLWWLAAGLGLAAGVLAAAAVAYF